MRARGSAILAAVVIALAVALAGAGCGQSAAPSAASGCWQFGVRAIERHAPVRSVPPACAGLSQAQLNQIVASAVRAAAGPHPKAVERRIAAADARYLGALVRGTGSAATASIGSPGTGSGPDRSPGPGLRLLALASWLATVTAGGYLFAGHRRPGARMRRPPAIAAGHAAVAVAGLAVWGAYAIGRGEALAWAATGLVIGTAALGMAVLLMSVPDPAAPGPQDATMAGDGPAPRRVIAIASHVALAVVTMLLVVLAATGGG